MIIQIQKLSICLRCRENIDGASRNFCDDCRKKTGREIKEAEERLGIREVFILNGK